MNKRLAGNIATSLAIKDKDNRIFLYVDTLIQEYEKKFGKPYSLNVSFDVPDPFEYKFSLDSFWVNFQKQNEFNPIPACIPTINSGPLQVPLIIT